MMRKALSSVLSAVVFGVIAVCAGICRGEELEGREVVVQVLRMHREKEGKLLEKVSAVIHGRKIKLDIDDVNYSTNFVVRGEDQNDAVVKKFVSEKGFRLDRNGLEFRLPVYGSEVEGREVLVRLYEDCSKDAGGYRLVGVPAAGGRIKFDFGEVGEAAAVALLGCDQEDKVIGLLLGHYGYAWAYREGLEFALPARVSGCDEQSLWWFVKDCSGNALSGGTVEVYLVPEERRVLISKATLNEDGGMRIPFCVGIGTATLKGRGIQRGLPAFLGSGPEHAAWEVRPWPCSTPYSCIAPVAAQGSEADSRCIRGSVRDSEGRPVNGALIKGEALYPPGGERVLAKRCQKSFCRTDSGGQFRFYLPIDDDNLQIGTLIPPGTRYHVRIEPPKGVGLLGFEGQIPNGQDVEIILDRGYFRRFVFEEESGVISEPAKLRDICVTIKQAGKADLILKYEDIKAGGMFPLGRFEAKNRSDKFEPIEVSVESPEELVFRMRSEEVVYRGQIVDGSTGNFMPGAFLIDLRNREEGIDPSGLTAEQWKALHGLPAATVLSDKVQGQVLSPLHHKYYWFSQAVRTDANGWFEMTLPRTSRIERLLVFEQDYLSVEIAIAGTTPDKNGLVELGVTKLFPAAKVVFEPWLEGIDKRQRKHILREWFIDRTECPGWAGDLLGRQNQESETRTRKGFQFDLKEPCSFYVPAGLNLLLQLRIWQEHEWSDPVLYEAVKLHHGEELKLGPELLGTASIALVQVVNYANGAVEGIPVTARSKYGDAVRNTDEKGVALFELPRGSRGEFVVENKSSETGVIIARAAIGYDLAQVNDANEVYTLRVSDEIVRGIMKR